MSDQGSPDAAEKCDTCGNPPAWHDHFKPMHPFNNGETGSTAFLGPRRNRDTDRPGSDASRGNEGPSQVVWPTDPVLRVALINAGVITADDLRKAEDTLKMSLGLGGQVAPSNSVQSRG